MTATDRLRALLDERGEHYETSGNKTWWGRPVDSRTGEYINVYHNQAQPMGEDRLFVEMQLATPEQAVEATLGMGECRILHMEREDETGCMAWAECDSCGAMLNGWKYLKGASYCPYCGRRVVE